MPTKAKTKLVAVKPHRPVVKMVPKVQLEEAINRSSILEKRLKEARELYTEVAVTQAEQAKAYEAEMRKMGAEIDRLTRELERLKARPVASAAEIPERIVIRRRRGARIYFQ